MTLAQSADCTYRCHWETRSFCLVRFGVFWKFQTKPFGQAMFLSSLMDSHVHTLHRVRHGAFCYLLFEAQNISLIRNSAKFGFNRYGWRRNPTSTTTLARKGSIASFDAIRQRVAKFWSIIALSRNAGERIQDAMTNEHASTQESLTVFGNVLTYRYKATKFLRQAYL